MIDPNYTTDVARDGQELIKDWLETKERVSSYQSLLNKAVCNASNAVNALGKWAMPSDAKEGEKVVMPYGRAFIEVHFVRFGTYEVKERPRSKT